MLQNQEAACSRSLPYNGMLQSPDGLYPSLCLAKSSSKELQPQHFIMARKQGRRAPVAAVIKMLTETQAKCTKCFTISKANVMYFFSEDWGRVEAVSNDTEIDAKL